MLEKNLARLGIFTINDLLTYYPYKYEKYEAPLKLSEAMDYCGRNQVISLKLRLLSRPLLINTGRFKLISVNGADETGRIEIKWFGQDYLLHTLKAGDSFIFRGKLEQVKGRPLLSQPTVHSEAEYMGLMETVQPIYALTKKVSEKKLRELTKKALSYIDGGIDYFEKIRDKSEELQELPSYREAACNMHFPLSQQEAVRARQRLVFDEFLCFALNLRLMKGPAIRAENSFVIENGTIVDEVKKRLPYALTKAQERVLGEIRQDLSGRYAMNRLVQGDVGSGKTIIAFLSMLAMAEKGYQSVLMAPTEVLARQHYEDLRKLLGENGLEYECELLCGSVTAKQKRLAKERLAEGKSLFAIGTHALIQEDVEFKSLGLAITDEQHRFGVNQRRRLGGTDKKMPHSLVMSATPIPRTLAIIIYGELDISVVDEMPKGRIPIKNCVVGPSFRRKSYEFIEKQIQLGHQAMVICPMVSSSEAVDAENVIDYTAKLKGELKDSIRVEFLHGKMKNREKNEIMERFALGEIDVLVSTTVIEVGINVPNATVIMIENSERFGLAQLHQLRGRVGRGSFESFCIFMCQSDDSQKKDRLEILGRSNDGFEIAREDLKQRGAGDLFGLRQSGDMMFRLGDICQDAWLLKLAAGVAEEILQEADEENPGDYKMLFREAALKRGLQGNVQL